MVEPEEGVFEQNGSWFHRIVDQALTWTRAHYRQTLIAGCVAAVALSAGLGRAPKGPTPTQASNPIQDHLLVGGERLVGPGPFVVWASTSTDASSTRIYAQDVSQTGSSSKELLGSIDGTAVGQTFGSPSLAGTSIPVQTGNADARPFLITRRGVVAVGKPSGSVLQFVVDPVTGSQAFLTKSSAAYTMVVRDPHGSHSVSFSVPPAVSALAPIQQFQPWITAWYASGREWLIGFTCGCDASPPPYTLTYGGALLPATWLDPGFAGGWATRDGSRVAFLQVPNCTQQTNDFDCPYGIALADLQHTSVKTIRRSVGAQSGIIVSPAEDLIAYGRIGARIDIARIEDGGIEGEAGYDAASLYPLAWIDESHIIAEADSPDLVSGQTTSQIVMITLPPEQNPPPQVIVAGSVGIQYLGLLR